MTFYKLETSIDSNCRVVKCPEIPDEFSFLGGHLIDASLLPPMHFEIEIPDNESLPHLIDIEVPLVSATFIDALNSAGIKNFQTFPAKVIHAKTQVEWQNYFAFNIVGCISAANMEQSKFTTLMPGNPEGVQIPYVAFEDLVINDQKVTFGELFRLAESETVIVVSERVYQSLKSNSPKDKWQIDAVKIKSAQ